MYPDDLKEFYGSLLIPQPLTIHKPTGSGSGTALKLNTRLQFEWKDIEEAPPRRIHTRTRGGLFIDFAKQKPAKDEKGNANFDWTNTQTLVTAKLGLVDLSGLLVAYREVRKQRRPVPVSLRPVARDTDTPEQIERKTLTASFTHKPGLAGSTGKGTTIISYTFESDGGVFRVSKSKEQVGQIKLTLAEEFRVFRMFDLAMDTLLRTGGR